MSISDESIAQPDRALFSHITSRLLPFLFLLYLVSYIDRVNVSFAGLHMAHDLGKTFTDGVFGLSGIFFLGYALFEIPSNLILERVGARPWISVIMVAWGIVSTCQMFVTGPLSFYAMRFGLGLAEAGFFPGMILYLTYWYPRHQRARAVATFMTATAISGVIGAPLSAFLLSREGLLGLHGWQWVFLGEGLPSILLGLVVLRVLPNCPHEARWLDEPQRRRLVELLRDDQANAGHGHSNDLKSALLDARVWLLTGVYFCISVGLYCMSVWLPQFIKQAWPDRSGEPPHADWQIALITGIPYSMAAISIVLVGRHSDRTGERRWHAAGSLLVGAAGALMAALVSAYPLGSIVALCIAAIGIWGAFGPFWSMPSAFLGGTGAAGGIALINSLGCLGGLAGPAITGFLKQHTGSFAAGLAMMSGTLFIGALGALCVRLGPSQSSSPMAADEGARTRHREALQ